MRDLVVVGLLIFGAMMTLLAAIGLIRFPDLLTRMHAATKTGTLGVGCTVLAVAVHFDDVGITARALLIVVFLFMTAPIAAHMIGRAAYFSGVELWRKTGTDDLRGRYDAAANTLRSWPDSPESDPPRAQPNQQS